MQRKLGATEGISKLQFTKYCKINFKLNAENQKK